MARWLLDSEVGWGMPHWIVAIPGLIALGLQDAAAALYRVAAWRRRGRG